MMLFYLLAALLLTVLKLSGVAFIAWWMVVLAVVFAFGRPLIAIIGGGALLLFLALRFGKKSKEEF